MKNDLKLNRERLSDVADHCYDILLSTSTKSKALELIADFVSSELGEYFTPDILICPDEISVNFIEILDQIVFEIKENIPGDNSIRDYIIEDIYRRISIYLDIFKDGEIYKSNLNKRMTTHEDTVIIKQYKMEEYLPELLKTYYEQPALQRSIIWSLLSFESDELLNFYYQIVKEENCLEVKVLALIGLKKFGSRFNNWRLINSDDLYKGLVDYAESFDDKNIEKNSLPGDLYSLLFVLNYIELNIKDLMHLSSIGWIIGVFNTTSIVDIDNSDITIIYRSISNIIIYADIDNLKLILEDEESLISFVSLIDSLPGEFFNRVSVKLSLLGEEFQRLVYRLIFSGSIELNESESNIMSCFFWESDKNL